MMIKVRQIPVFQTQFSLHISYLTTIVQLLPKLLRNRLNFPLIFSLLLLPYPILMNVLFFLTSLNPSKSIYGMRQRDETFSHFHCTRHAI